MAKHIYMVSGIWREPGIGINEWTAGAVISTSDVPRDKPVMVLSFLREQKVLHPKREWAGTFYVEELNHSELASWAEMSRPLDAARN